MSLPEGEIQKWRCQLCKTWNPVGKLHCKKCSGEQALIADAYAMERSLSVVEKNFYSITAVEILAELQSIRRLMQEIKEEKEDVV